MGYITICQFILIGFVAVYLAVNMIHIVRLRPVKGPLKTVPFVSVCVPARNEERAVRACLDSLLGQDYPRMEIIAVDDHSVDRTPHILKSIADSRFNVKFISGDPLPPGWYGKAFALHQASRYAKGEYLLFTDADPVFKPNAITTAVYQMQNAKLDVLTLMPGGKFGSFWECVVQPVIFAFIAGLTRFRKINSQESRRAMGIGAFLMFRRSVYEGLGGHERVKQKVVEDIELAKYAKRDGFKLLIADGKSIFSIRMYYSLKEICLGWRKNMFVALKRSIFRAFYYLIIVLGFQVTSYGVFFFNLFTGQATHLTILSALGVLLVWTVGKNLCEELGLAPHYIFLFPLGVWSWLMEGEV